MNKKGYINILALGIIGLVVLGGSLLGSWIAQPKTGDKPTGAFALVVPQGGTGNATMASGGILIGNGTEHVIASSSPVVSSIHATSTTISSEIEGTLVVNNITVTGTCTGCAGASTADFQDAYNNSAVDAQITTADAKEFVYFISDTTDPAEFIISAADQGSLQINVGSTTNQTLFAYGAHGIGTTSPGGGLAVNATSTILSGPAYILDHLRTSYIIATSTQNNTLGGALDVTEAATSTFTGGISASTGGLLSTTGFTLSGGDLLLSSGKITQVSASTSTIPNLDSSTFLRAASLFVSGSGTTTFNGGASLLAGGLRVVAGGLDVQGGDAIIAGKITSGAGTSTIPSLSVSTNLSAVNVLITGDLNVDTGTSTLQGATFTGITSSSGAVLSAGDLLLTNGRITLAGSSTSTLPVLSVNTLNVALDSQLQGKLTVTSTATSTIPALNVSTAASVLNLLVTGDLNVDTGTSTFGGGINIVAQGLGITAGGLNITAGDLLTAGVIKISSTGTSTNAGTFAVNSTTGTSTFANALSVLGNIFGGKSIVAGVASTTGDLDATTTIAFSCTSGNLQTAMLEEDVRVIVKDECMAGQILRFWIDASASSTAGVDLQVDWDGMADANGEFGSSTLMLPTTGTSSPGYIWQGRINRCAIEFMSTATTSTKASYGILQSCVPY